MDTCPESSASLPPGRAEPAPPRGGLCELGWPCGEDLETMRRAIFSEGRGPRAHEYRPDANRGTSPSPAHWRGHGGQKTPHSGWRDADVGGVRSPPLPSSIAQTFYSISPGQPLPAFLLSSSLSSLLRSFPTLDLGSMSLNSM